MLNNWNVVVFEILGVQESHAFGIWRQRKKKRWRWRKLVLFSGDFLACFDCLLFLLFCFIPLASGFILQCPNGILMDPSPAISAPFQCLSEWTNERVLSSCTEKMAQRLWRLLKISLMWRRWRIPPQSLCFYHIPPQSPTNGGKCFTLVCWGHHFTVGRVCFC